MRCATVERVFQDSQSSTSQARLFYIQVKIAELCCRRFGIHY